jgi:hypothetical protein
MNRNKIIFAISVIFAFNCSDKISSYFANQKEAINSTSWEGNWIPKRLPIDAYDIYETHDLDLNAIIMKYKANRNLKKDFDTTLIKIQAVNIPKYALIGEKWWPAPLYKEARYSSNEYWYYEDSTGNYAVQFMDTATAYYWRNK